MPKENAREAGIVGNIEIIGVETLIETIKYINEEIEIKGEQTELNSVIEQNTKYNMDFKNVKGQKSVKRALEVSAAGAHNVLIIRCAGFSERR